MPDSGFSNPPLRIQFECRLCTPYALLEAYCGDEGESLGKHLPEMDKQMREHMKTVHGRDLD